MSALFSAAWFMLLAFPPQLQRRRSVFTDSGLGYSVQGLRLVDQRRESTALGSRPLLVFALQANGVLLHTTAVDLAGPACKCGVSLVGYHVADCVPVDAFVVQARGFRGAAVRAACMWRKRVSRLRAFHVCADLLLQILRRHEFFGQYGKVLQIVVNKNQGSVLLLFFALAVIPVD